MYTILFVSYPMDTNTSRSCHGGHLTKCIISRRGVLFSQYPRENAHLSIRYIMYNVGSECGFPPIIPQKYATLPPRQPLATSTLPLGKQPRDSTAPLHKDNSN